MFSTQRFRFLALAVVGVAVLAWSLPGRSLTDTLTYGKADLQSAGALTFGPENILFVGDALGAAVFALDVADEAMAGEAPVRIENVDEKIAALLGTTKDDISINDIAVHSTSQRVYFSVSRGQGETSMPVLLRTTGSGGLEEVSLDNIRFSKGAITNAPAPDARLRRGLARPYAITDLAFVDGEVFVAGLSNEEFASHFRKLSFPFNDAMTSTSLEIYHVSHHANETHAPINTFTPFTLNGEPHLVATYTCTPLVTFAVKDLQNGAHVKGKTVAELGSGNRALGMTPYEKDGQTYLLVANSRHPLMRIDPNDVADAKALEMPTEEHGVAFTALSPEGIVRIALINDDYVAALQQGDGEALHLVALATDSL